MEHWLLLQSDGTLLARCSGNSDRRPAKTDEALGHPKNAQRFAKCLIETGVRGVGSIWFRSGNSTKLTQGVFPLFLPGRVSGTVAAEKAYDSRGFGNHDAGRQGGTAALVRSFCSWIEKWIKNMAKTGHSISRKHR
jgi:hypothetical protein